MLEIVLFESLDTKAKQMMGSTDFRVLQLDITQNATALSTTVAVLYRSYLCSQPLHFLLKTAALNPPFAFYICKEAPLDEMYPINHSMGVFFYHTSLRLSSSYQPLHNTIHCYRRTKKPSFALKNKLISA